MLSVKDISIQASSELADILSLVEQEQINELVKEILKADKIFVHGAGRSLLMLRAFAMRLMHIGFDVYVVGDTITPAYTENDLLIFGSASGETGGLVRTIKKAKEIGGKIATITIFEDSTLAENSNVVVKVPAYTDKLPESETNRPNVLPGGSMFEISMLVVLDSMIIPLGKEMGVDTNKYFDRHANLE